MKSKNEKVQNFLEGILIIDAEQYNSLIEMRKIVFDIYPETVERMMYGGIMFSLNSEDFGGLFVRKNHISFEFGNGYKMKDPYKYLEGSGKFRRHLKIRTQADIKNKEVVFFETTWSPKSKQRSPHIFLTNQLQSALVDSKSGRGIVEKISMKLISILCGRSLKRVMTIFGRCDMRYIATVAHS